MALKKAEAPPASHEAGSLETLVTWAKAEDGKTIWYSRTEVSATEEPGNPAANVCKLPLAPSPQFKALIDLDATGKNGAKFTQAEIIRLLRTTFASAAPAGLLDSVRKLKIDKAKQVEASQTKGKVSLNRSDIAEMSGATDIPDDVVFDVPIFAAGTLYARCGIRVVIELDAENERLILIVLPGEIEKAWTSGENWLLSELTGLMGKDGVANIPLYLGTP